VKQEREIIWKVYLLYVFVLLFIFLIVFQVVRVQVSSEWKAVADNYKGRILDVKPPRGNIYADDGISMLATSVPNYEVRMDPVTVSKKLLDSKIDSLALCLSRQFGRSQKYHRDRILKARVNGNRYLKVIKRKIKYDELQQLKGFPIFRKGQNKGGLIIIEEARREKLYGLLASRTIGWERIIEADTVRRNGQIKKIVKGDTISVGLESAFGNALRGKEGKRLMRRVGGKWRPVTGGYKQEPQMGRDVYTTIDINIQDVAENALKKQLELQNAKHGCVVLMEVETGYIKAIANLSRSEGGNYWEQYNHAIGRGTDPGSTFKLASLMVALEDEKIRITDTVNTGNGIYDYFGIKLEDSKSGGYGKITIQNAFEVSSNVISRVINDSYKKDPQKFVDGLKNFGLHQPTGIEIPGERTPLIKDVSNKSWSGITLPWMSIGYELEQTPLQTLTFYNAVANDGVVVKPQLVKEIREGDRVVKSFEPIVVDDELCSQSTIEKAKKMLEGVVERGTARNVRVSEFKIAGKTGTAKMVEGSNGYGDDTEAKYQASFVGYFPAEKPKYSCIVVIAAPSKSIYGAVVSGSVFNEIARKVFATDLQFHDNVADERSVDKESNMPASSNGDRQKLQQVFSVLDIPLDADQSEARWVATHAGQSAVKLYNRKINNGLVPNVKGMGLQDALYLLEGMRMRVRVLGAGIVKEQSVDPGIKIKTGDKITLKLS